MLIYEYHIDDDPYWEFVHVVEDLENNHSKFIAD